MASFLTSDKEIYDLYTQGKEESKSWREDYHEYERLADNGLMDGLDEDLPEVNDGSLSASLYKLPKRIVSSKLAGRFIVTDRDDAWLPELANIVWEKQIIPNANSQAPFHRKWKDAVRKAAIYGSVPLITLFVERGDYIGADFIVAQPQDVTLEPSKVSDYDSDIMYWDVFMSKQQVRKLIQRAKAENKEAKKSDEESYNKWDIKALEETLTYSPEEERDPRDDHVAFEDKPTRRKGIHFCVAVQRGVDAPFYMYHKGTKKRVREWSNPDPTGDTTIHFLYCYQDFVNPYGTGIVKLAGGTQNVLDYMRQVDVLATQLGFKPPVSIGGDIDTADLDSIVYAQDAQWMIGNAIVKREQIGDAIYQQLPERISMYKTSLNQLIPTGDTSISAGAGDPQYSKTPAGVKFQAQSLSIDDEDFKDNLYMTYEAVARSMVNTHFANMQGTDMLKLTDDERDLLIKAGMDWPKDEDGKPTTNELEIVWENVRGQFNFEMDVEADKASDEEKRLEGLLKVAELRQSDPLFDQRLLQSGKRINDGELYSDIISLTSDNDKIIEDVSPEDQADEALAVQGQEQMQPQGQMAPEQQPPMQEAQPEPNEDEVNLQAVMEQYGVDEPTGMAMLEAEKQGFEPEEILEALSRRQQMEAVNG